MMLLMVNVTLVGHEFRSLCAVVASGLCATSIATDSCQKALELQIAGHYWLALQGPDAPASARKGMDTVISLGRAQGKQE